MKLVDELTFRMNLDSAKKVHKTFMFNTIVNEIKIYSNNSLFSTTKLIHLKIIKVVLKVYIIHY
jgi:hypothetical protein